MSTTAIKLGSLAIKTLAKPIASKIKQQAREHPRFRKICIVLAQRIHQVDVRLRLGLLQDTAAFLKAEQAERDAARQAAKKVVNMTARYPADLGTVSSVKPIPPPAVFGPPRPHHPEPPKRPRVRPLSESKAIESGANFISEFFLFAVAGALILAEQIRVRRKEASRRDLVSERLEMLENRTRQDEMRLAELEQRGQHDEERILTLEEENWKLKDGKGAFPGRVSAKKELKVFEPTPLWEEVSQKGTSIWASIWGFGGKTDSNIGGTAKTVFVGLEKTQTADEKNSPVERGNTAASISRLPAVIKKIRPTLNSELPTSEKPL